MARVKTGFEDLDALLRRFLSRVDPILAGNVLGAYLTGSFALGGGDAASDCDFLVVTERPLSADEERALRELHEEILTWPGYWAYNLEGSYAPRADLQTLDALGRPWLYVNRGSGDPEWSNHDNTEDVRWVLRERPLTLVGPEPREFACEVPAVALQRKMRPELANFLDDLLSWASFEVSWTQRYAVEAPSRMLYTLEHGEVISKPSALDWALRDLPADWHDLLRQVQADRFVRWNDPPRPGSVERARAFVAYVQERARA